MDTMDTMDMSPSPAPIDNCIVNSGGSSAVVGFVAALIAVFFFGTNYIPVKRYDPGDGMFFQWVMGSGVLLVGFAATAILHGDENYLPFYPMSLIGGALWSSGNVMTVTVIKLIGLGMGVLVWGLANLTMGWLTGTFGLFGTDAAVVGIPILNYIGFFLALVSMVIFGFVKPATESDSQREDSDSLVIQSSFSGHLGYEEPSYDGSKIENSPELMTEKTPIMKDFSSRPTGVDPEAIIESVFGENKRYVGFAMALLMGAAYGSAFTPSQHTIAKCLKSPYGIDYVFSQFLGIFITCTIWYILYVVVTKNNPTVNPQIVLPALVSGMMWGTAQIFFFVANAQLGLSVSFPIVALGPGIVASIIGIVVYGEIQGARNLLIFGVAFAVSATAITLITLSKLLGDVDTG